MLHPSYTELIQTMNHDAEENGNPEIKSRYSVVIAAAKRARQIIAGQEPLIACRESTKPLSIAVEELRTCNVRIIAEGKEEQAPEHSLEETIQFGIGENEEDSEHSMEDSEHSVEEDEHSSEEE